MVTMFVLRVQAGEGFSLAGTFDSYNDALGAAAGMFVDEPRRQWLAKIEIVPVLLYDASR